MRRAGLAGSVAVITLLGCLTQAQAAWEICNKTPDEMSVAIAYVNPGGGFISEGWWNLRACGGCKKVLVPSDTSDHKNVFYRAEGGGTIEGDSQFCVSNSSFKMNGKGNCPVKKGFRHKEINLADWRTNITGQSPSGRVCID
jgi:uncharacterized membrane protein